MKFTKLTVELTADNRFTVKTDSSIADNLYWHEMIGLVSRCTVPDDDNECFSFFRSLTLFDN